MDIFSLFLDCLLRPVFESNAKLARNLSIVDGEEDDDENNDDDGRSRAKEDFLVDDEDNDANLDAGGVQRQGRSASHSDIEQRQRRGSSSHSKHRRQRRKKSVSKRPANSQRPGDNMLDLNGPKLYNGCKGLILFYQIIGHLNWLDQPLLFSILYKVGVSLLTNYVIYHHFIVHFFRINIIDHNYRNPIFIFISLLSGVSCFSQTLIGMYTNLFNLCPMMKILTTQKLCFINEEIQNIVGTRMLKYMCVFLIYHCCLVSLMVCQNVDEFVNNFDLLTFLLDSFCVISLTMHLFGMSHFDFYIRSSFGFWLIAMKFNLEHRFTFLHKYQRKQRILEQNWNKRQAAAGADEGADNVSKLESSGSFRNRLSKFIRTSSSLSAASTLFGGGGAAQMDHQQHQGNKSPLSQARPKSTQSQDQLEREFNETYKFVTFDEIQKNLNNMDDHLEVWRSVQTSSLVVITLNAFLTNGALLLLGYNLIVNQANYYHGFIMLLLSINYTVIVFFCYIGDSWISYALSSFVQTVEDEYFLQGAEEPQLQQQLAMEANHSERQASLARQHQSLLIKKKDVLFCREFLHQFENHLATPWSKLTVKTHLHMLRTFVTLIAAQIIFDHEH